MHKWYLTGRMLFMGTDIAAETEKKDHDKQLFTEMEKAKIAGLVLVFIGIFGALAYGISYFANSGGSGSLAACESHLSLASKYSCIGSLANSTGNFSLCSVLPAQQSPSCIYDVALAHANISACSLINSSKSLYPQCIVSLAKSSYNYTYCGKVRGTAALDCIASVAVAHGFPNITECATVNNSTLDSACTDLYNYHYALAQNNAGYCSALSGKPGYDSSYIILHASTLNQSGHSVSLSAEADFLAQNGTLADYCYYSLAAQENNPALCALGSTPAASNLCAHLLQNVNTILASNTVTT